MLTHTKITKTVFSQWIGSTLQCNVAPSLSSRYHPSFVPGSSHLEDPSAPKLTTHLSKNSLPLSAHVSFSLFQFIFTKVSIFLQFLLCWFSRKGDTSTLQFATYLKCLGLTRARCPASFSRSCRKRSWPKQPGDRCQLQKLVPGTQVHPKTLK